MSGVPDSLADVAAAVAAHASCGRRTAAVRDFRVKAKLFAPSSPYREWHGHHLVRVLAEVLDREPEADVTAIGEVTRFRSARWSHH